MKILTCISVLITFLVCAASAQKEPLQKDSFGRKTILVIPEIPPYFHNYDEYIRKNLRWPNNEACIQGTVYIQCTIDTLGNVKDVIVKKGFHPAFDAEAIRVIENMPPWIPGKLNGNTIETRINLPVRFE